MKTGEKVIVNFVEVQYNTNRKKCKEINGIFIKDYGNYIQILDKYNIRRSIMKHDLVKILYA